MRFFVLIMPIILFAGNVNAELSKTEFSNLDIAEQNRLLVSSYKTANTLLALSGISDDDAKSGPREMFSCMKDRDVNWLRKTYLEFSQKYPEMASTFSQNLSISIGWKCGLLSFAEKR